MSTDDVSILMVDDQENNLVALEACLEPLNVELIPARSGEEALKCLLEREYAAVLLDVQMPGMDGFETADLIRRRDRTKHVPILFLTAINKSDTHVLRGYALGAVDYMFKPIVPEILRSKVQVFVDLYRMRQREHLVVDALARKTRELERSNVELEQFARAVALDLKEPLEEAAQRLRALETHPPEPIPSSVQAIVEKAADDVTRMQGLIGDLLAYAKAGTGVRDLVPTSVGPVLERVTRAAAETLSASGSVITRDELPVVMADASQLERILTILIDNAVAYRRDEPLRIHVGAERQDDDWVLSVRDNGIGIEEKDISRIFGLFARIHGRDQPGSGMGLAVCKKIVERWGGRIWVDSEPRVGSTFSFTLAAATDARPTSNDISHPGLVTSTLPPPG